MRQVNDYLYELNPSVFALVMPGYENLGNSGIVITEEGVVLIETDVRTVGIVSDMLREITDQPVKFVINSHHDFDHSSANCVFANQGATIVGSQNCRQAMIEFGEYNFSRWSDRNPDIKRIMEEKSFDVTLPQLTFDHSMKLHLGDKTLELSYHGHAHSPGDIVVFLPQDQVLFAGDLLWIGYFPNTRSADILNQLDVVDHLLSFPTRYYVPGHGNITDNRDEILAMKNYISLLYDRISQMVANGNTLEEVRTIEETLIKEHSDWKGTRFITPAVDALYQRFKGE